MKNKIFTLVLIMVTLNLSAQQWATVGSKWYYSSVSINPYEHTYKTFESISDTIISSTTCYKLIESSPFTNPHSKKYHYMFSRNDSVFFYADGTFNLLYDFGAQPGDTILLPYFHNHDSSPLKMIIDSVRTIDINGHNRILQSITCGDGFTIGFGPKVIEGIGSTYFMFPTYDMTYDGPLRCFNDTIVGLYTSPSWTLSCDTIYYTGITDYEQVNSISICPNPTIANVKILNLTIPAEFNIISTMGAIVKTGYLRPNEELILSDLPNGLYFLRLISNGNITNLKIIKN